MNKFKLTTGLTTAAMVLSAFAPSAFAADVTVGGNGAFSVNGVVVNSAHKSVTKQSNTSVVTTVVNSNTTTGGNGSSFNTGSGNNAVVSGNAVTNVNVGVGGSSNTAKVNPCGCLPTVTPSVNVGGNGAFSRNGVVLNSASLFKTLQENLTAVMTGVTSNTSTGGNGTHFNTGNGGEVVQSGHAATNVDVVVTGSNNN